MLHLTPDILRATYGYLLAMPPFKRWKLPDGDAIKFKVSAHHDHMGLCWRDGDQVCIAISVKCVGRTDTLIRVMAHEIVHVHCDARGVKSKHGAEFHRCAALVCRHHGFDPKAF